jgi:hypothetical protein
VKLLLTSAGVKNASIHKALVDLLGKPIANSTWAAEIAGPAYAIDDETAIRVVDGAVDVVSGGRWTLLSS